MKSISIAETLQDLRTALGSEGRVVRGVNTCIVFHLGNDEFSPYDVTVLGQQVGTETVSLRGILSTNDHNSDLYYALKKHGADKQGIHNTVSLYTPPYHGPVDECVQIVLSDLRGFVALVARVQRSLESQAQ